VGATPRDRVTQDKVKKKSQQVREQSCDQNPEDCPHSAPTSVRKNETEAQKPDSENDPERERSAAIHGHCPQHSALVSGLVSRNQPNQQRAARQHWSPKLNGLRNST